MKKGKALEAEQIGQVGGRRMGSSAAADLLVRMQQQKVKALMKTVTSLEMARKALACGNLKDADHVQVLENLHLMSRRGLGT